MKRPYLVDPQAGGSPRAPRAVTGRAADENWTLSYLDVLTVLLVVFIFFRHPGSGQAVDAPADGPPAQAAAAAAAPPSPAVEALAAGAPASERIRRVRSMVASVLQRGAPDQEVELVSRQRGFQLEIGESVLYAPGSAELSPQGRGFLMAIAPALAAGGMHISVEGHTDEVPIQNHRFPSNWELSTARATIVVRQLMAAGIPKSRLRAIGYADTRPRSAASGAEGRAKNRRVSLVVEAG